MWSPRSITLGVRHERIFGFLGRAGDAIDGVRRAEGSRAIPSNLFTQVQWPNQITARLLNKDGSLIVDFNIEGIILIVDLEKMRWSRQRAKEIFLEVVRIGLDISRGAESINRIGVLDNYEFEYDSPGAVAVNAITSLQNVGDASDFTFRASFRHSTDMGLFRTDTEDWLNTIIQIGAVKSDDDVSRPDTLRVSIDHQIYFVPERRYSPALVHDHHDGFLEYVERLQRGTLAGLGASDRAVHGG